MKVEPQKLEAFPAQIHQMSLGGVQSQLQLPMIHRTISRARSASFLLRQTITKSSAYRQRVPSCEYRSVQYVSKTCR
jgi:hypothetical protein